MSRFDKMQSLRQLAAVTVLRDHQSALQPWSDDLGDSGCHGNTGFPDTEEEHSIEISQIVSDRSNLEHMPSFPKASAHRVSGVSGFKSSL
jgi:hypothetical protein